VNESDKTITHEAYDDRGELIGQITVPVHDTDPTLLWLLRRAGESWGPLGVALVAARMTDPEVLIAHLTSGGGVPNPEPSR